MENQNYILNIRKAIEQFEYYINNCINLNLNENIGLNGYLINLKDYEEFKNKIYNNNNNINSNEDVFPLKQIKLRTSHYLVNMLLNGNEFILITPELWKVVCNIERQNDHPIVFCVINRQIYFTLADKKQFIFNFNDSKKFIIDKSSFYNIDDYFSKYNYNDNIIENTFNSIIQYYNFENDFSMKLIENKNNLEEEKYFLISKNWIDKWKSFSNYEIIKSIFLDKGKIDASNIKDYIIYDQELYYKFNYIFFDDLKLIYFKNKEEMENYLQNDLLAIISINFISLFDKVNPNYYMRYTIQNNIISINFDNGILNFKSNDNIISKYKSNDFRHLNQLLRIYFFQKELKEQISIPHKISNKFEENNIYLIDRNTINKYKDYFHYNELLKDLENNNKTKNLNYYNYASNLEMSVINNVYINNYKILQNNINSVKDLNSYCFNVFQCPFKNNLKYIKDFEIINEDIKFYFEESQIFGNIEFIKGKYIGEAKKIFIIFEYQTYNYYELGFFDSKGNLQIEYLIEETKTGYKELIINYFKSFNFEYIYKNIFPNENNNNLFLGKINIGNFYKIGENSEIKNDNNNENVQNYQNNKFILDILSSLISLYLFENYLIIKIKESSKNTFSKNNNSNIDVMDICYLVNKNSISKLKTMFSYQEIENIIKLNNINSNSTIDKSILSNINEHYLKTILNKQKDFEQFILNNQLLQIEKSPCKNNSQIVYPTNFNILNYDSYQKLLQICHINENEKQNDPIYLGFNYGKIILREFNQNSNQNNYNEQFFVYVVSLEQKDIDINYIQEILFAFYGNSPDIVNNFNKAITDVDIVQSYTFNSNSFHKKNNCTGYIINQKINDEINKKENSLYKYLSYINNLYNEFSVLYKKINEQNSSNLTDEEYNYYLINRNYISDVKSLLHFKDISTIIENIQNFGYSFDPLKNLREQIKEELYNSLIELNPEIIKNKLKDKNSYLLSTLEENTKEPFYYNNCQIISKNIKVIFDAIDPNNFKDNNNHNFIKLVKCIFDKGKIILLLNKSIINLGKLNENNELNIDYIIKLNNNSLDTIFTNIKKNGYYFIEKFFINPNKKFTKEINLDKKLFKLIEEYNISEKLQILILMVIQEQNLMKNNIMKENNKYQKVCLINKKWLLNYQYENLCSIIQRDEKIKEFIEGYNNLKKSIDWNAINYNISSSSVESLKEIDIGIKNINSSIYKPDEQLININNKSFLMPKEFIIVDEQICKLLKKNFKILLSNTCDYFKKNDNIILKLDSKDIILILNITNESNSYNIKYILKYNKLKKEEFNEIYSEGIEEYLKQKTIFNENNKNDCISPIFSSNNIIGNCYKYVCDYTNCIDYNDYLSNDNLKKY